MHPGVFRLGLFLLDLNAIPEAMRQHKTSSTDQAQFRLPETIPLLRASDSPEDDGLGEVLQREVLYKHKLGTRATGLNSN